jgi:large subunit ribosomal protein L25
MPMQELTIVRRSETGKGAARRARRSGSVPAILYGGQKPETITVDPKDVLRVIHGHAGTTQLLSLRIEGENGGTRLAVLRELQFDPVSEHLLHVDLQEVSATKPITVRVAVHPSGEAIGVKDTNGILNLVLHELSVTCLPTAIPERIEADVSELRIGDVLTVASLVVPEGVRILNDAGQAVATVRPPMAEEVATPAAEAPAAAVATTEPEVLSERKPKEEAEADDAKKKRDK